LTYIPVVVTDACGYGNALAAQRTLAALAFAGGSIQCDCGALIQVLRTTSERRMVG